MTLKVDFKIIFPTVKTMSGTDVYTERLCSSLRDRGVDAKIIWLNKHYELFPFLLKFKKYPKADIVHANSWNAFALHHLGKKLVITEHHCVTDPEYYQYKTFLQKIYHRIIGYYEKIGFKKADAIISVSQFTTEALKRSFSISPTNTIYNWIDAKKFSPSKIDISNRKFTLLFVGNPTYRKGADILPKLMEELDDNFELRISSGRKKPKKLRPIKNATYLPYLSEKDLINEYRNCDAFLFPSRYEGFGYAMFEAMACGKSVIANKNSLAKNFIKNEHNGYLIDTDNILELSNLCQYLLNNRDKLSEIGKNGRELVLQTFNEAKQIEEYLKIYVNLLNDKPSEKKDNASY